MNNVTLSGRLTKEPEVRYSQGENSIAIARYTLAVQRNEAKREGQPDADFINCVAFGREAEFAEKYFNKATKIEIVGRIQTGSYTNRESKRVYYTEVRVLRQEFGESKADAQQRQQTTTQTPTPTPTDSDGFMNIPDGIDEELPFA